ncbi:hypothetical protein Q9L58_010442 [Maublancomyces gigas]|uniref:Uncharacterized protein n=1 Tax=Discina gigas TaxID=1032678 RepID=A0ABR3G456_9PEZI
MPHRDYSGLASRENRDPRESRSCLLQTAQPPPYACPGQNIHPHPPALFGPKRSDSHLSPQHKRPTLPNTVTAPAPVRSRDLRPPIFNLLKDQYEAEYPNAAQPLPNWTWPEFQVHADRYARVHIQEPHFQRQPDGSQVVIHAANRKKDGCNRRAYPRAGPRGTPIAILDRNTGWGGPQPPNPYFPVALPPPAPTSNFLPCGTQASTDPEDDISIGVAETKQEMVEVSNEEGTTTDTAAKAFLKDIFPFIAPEVQYLVWHMTKNNTLVTQNINMAQEQISGLYKAVYAKAAAITKLTATVQNRRANPPPLTNTNKPMGHPNGKGKAPSHAAPNGGKEEETGTPFQPENTRMNRQVIVEKDCPIPDNITNDAIVTVVNNAIAHHSIGFLSARRSQRGNLMFETTPNTSADTGASLSIEINMALDQLSVFIKGVHAKSRSTGYVIHGVPSHIRTTHTPDVPAKTAEEITTATGFTLAQAPRWMNSQASSRKEDSAPSSSCSQAMSKTKA